MNSTLAILSALTLVAVAGCTAPQGTDEEDVASDDAALSGIIDEPAEVPSGAKPKVEEIDLSTIAYDLPPSMKDSSGRIDFSKLQVDVLDTRTYDRDRALNLKWVESDKRELPSFVDKIVNGVDVAGGGKCRIKSLGLKKLVVGCKWTW